MISYMREAPYDPNLEGAQGGKTSFETSSHDRFIRSEIKKKDTLMDYPSSESPGIDAHCR